MKNILYLTLLLPILCFCQGNEKKYVLSEPAIVPTGGNNASYVLESPDGKHLLFTNDNVSEVYLMSLTPDGKPALIFTSPGCGYFPAWSADSKKIFMRSKTQEGTAIKNEVVEYALVSGSIEKRPDLDFRVVQSLHNLKAGSDPVVFVNEKLQLVKTDLKKSFSVTLEANKQCYQPILSPDRQKAAVHTGNEIWVYDLNNRTAPVKIGVGLAIAWSPDSKFLTGFLDESADGHEISNSELYLYDIAAMQTHPLTSSKDVAEMNPSFSSDGKTIYFTNYHDGSVYSARIKQN